ncbi:serine protease [Rhodococcus sp. SJ-3]|uniref:serine protease n=1 Tax=Rhodococcus sp. SJ-3 TaxID=3454628 RepID=UPI003F7A0EDF
MTRGCAVKRGFVASSVVAALALTIPGVAVAGGGDDRVVLRPGDGITFSPDPAPGWCSVAAVGRDHANRLVAVTAGHCRQSGSALIWKVGEQHRGPVGIETDVASTGSVDPIGFPTDEAPDYAVLLLDDTKVRGSNTSEPNDRGQRVVLESVGSLAPGDSAVGVQCATGRTNGVACASGGMLVDENLMSSALLMKPGDSGGPLVRADTGEWIGLSVGYRPTRRGLAAYQRADRIIEEIDAHGGIGAGFTLVDAP